MILELDLGNTRAKWRLLNGRAEIVARGVDGVTSWLEGHFPDAWNAGIGRVRIASVLSPITESLVISQMQSKLLVSPQMARSTSSCGEVINAYVNPERLGVDRWLALIAAYQKSGGAVLVIDVGTALKVDAVDDAGKHIGGYIIPGAALMEKSLLDGTDRVRYESAQPMQDVSLGADTRDCVQNGITAALVGAALVSIEQCRAAIGKQPPLLITGGLGMAMKDCLEAIGVRGSCYEADLVLDGLAWVLP